MARQIAMSAELASVARHVEAGDLDCEALRVRVARYDWTAVHEALVAEGVAVIPSLFDRNEARALAAWYQRDELFRSRIVMERHSYGRGEYQYFAAPLPAAILALREELYARLVPVANRWAQASRTSARFPVQHGEFIAQCRAANQTRPTPLLLRYVAGDYNCLHQDLYGGVYFPLQVAALLSEPGSDFEGGELV